MKSKTQLLIVLTVALVVLQVLRAQVTSRNSIPLNSATWTPIGPGPALRGLTSFRDPSSGRITAVAPDPTDPNVIYVGAAGGGVWKTMNAQTPDPADITWTQLTDTQSLLFIGAIAVAPSSPAVIYAGTGEANMGPSKAREFRDNIYYGFGILKSTDSGSNWALLGSTEFRRRTISKIVVDPTTPDTVYAAVGALATNGLPGNTGIWKSTDGGATWTNTTAGISTEAAFSDLVIDPSAPQTLYAAVGEPGVTPVRVRNGVYKTSDGGGTWTRLTNFPSGSTNNQVGRITLALAASAPLTLYAAITRPGPPNSNFNSFYRIMKTTDGGDNWATVNDPGMICQESGRPNVNYMSVSGDYHTALAVDPADPDTVYAGGLCLIRGTSGGQIWTAIAQGQTTGPHHDHHALAFDSTRHLLNGNDGGIWRLDDPVQVTWADLNGDLQITQLIGIALHPTNPDIALGGTQDIGTVRFEGSIGWPRLLRGDGGLNGISSADPNRMYQITEISTSDPAILRRSFDGGNTWEAQSVGVTDRKNFYPPLVLDPSLTDPNADRLLLGTDRAYQSTDGGDSWVQISTPGMGGWTATENIDSLAAAPSDRDTIYASAAGHIFVTLDRGVSWQQRDIAGLDNAHFHALLVDPASNLTAYAVRDRFDGGHVFYTTDSGQNWTDISGDLPNLPAYAIALDPRTTPNTLYVGTDNGVFASTDLGGHWSVFRAALPNVQVVDLKLNLSLNILAAATHGRGVWEILTTDTSASRNHWLAVLQ